MHDHGAQPFVIGVVQSDLAGPFLVLEEFLVALRQLRFFDQASVIGGGVVIRIDAIPAAVRVASLRNEDGRLGRVELQQHLGRQPVHRGGDREIPAALPRPVLDCHARDDDGVGRAHIVHLHSRCILEHLPERQPFLLVDRGIDGERAFSTRRGGEIRHEPGRALADRLLGRPILGARRRRPKADQTDAGCAREPTKGAPAGQPLSPRPSPCPGRGACTG